MYSKNKSKLFAGHFYLVGMGEMAKNQTMADDEPDMKYKKGKGIKKEARGPRN